MYRAYCINSIALKIVLDCIKGETQRTSIDDQIRPEKIRED